MKLYFRLTYTDERVRTTWIKYYFSYLICQVIKRFWKYVSHYNDVIMSSMASQITSLTIVVSIVYSRRRSKKTSKLRVTGLCEGNSPMTGEFPAQRTSNAGNVSIWWRHRGWHNLSLIAKSISETLLLTRISYANVPLRAKMSIYIALKAFDVMIFHDHL